MRSKIDLIAHTIPHWAQKYDTVGNYRSSPDMRVIEISDMRNSDYEFLVLIHEIIEQHLCIKAGIKDQDITDFDIAFEKKRKSDEPGNDPKAPYHEQHMIAGKIERELARLMKISWREYDKAVMAL